MKPQSYCTLTLHEGDVKRICNLKVVNVSSIWYVTVSLACGSTEVAWLPAPGRSVAGSCNSRLDGKQRSGTEGRPGPADDDADGRPHGRSTASSAPTPLPSLHTPHLHALTRPLRGIYIIAFN